MEYCPHAWGRNDVDCENCQQRINDGDLYVPAYLKDSEAIQGDLPVWVHLTCPRNSRDSLVTAVEQG